MSRRGKALRWIGVGSILVGAALGCRAAAEDTPAPPLPEPSPVSSAQLRLEFEDGAAEIGAVVPSAMNLGVADVQSTAMSQAGGRILRVEGRTGGFALRFPRFRLDGSDRLAVLDMIGRKPDTFDPGEVPFRFGADFTLDAASSGTVNDNGDNLMQRGLSTEEAQYKIQLDHRVPSCRIQGTKGEVVVKATTEVEPDSWYRVTCERSADEVTLVLGRFDDRGRLSVQRWSGRGPIGSVALAGSDSHLAVGGKLTASGALVQTATDQFNGVVDNVFYKLLGG